MRILKDVITELKTISPNREVRKKVIRLYKEIAFPIDEYIIFEQMLRNLIVYKKQFIAISSHLENNPNQSKEDDILTITRYCDNIKNVGKKEYLFDSYGNLVYSKNPTRSNLYSIIQYLLKNKDIIMNFHHSEKSMLSVNNEFFVEKENFPLKDMTPIVCLLMNKLTNDEIKAHPSVEEIILDSYDYLSSVYFKKSKSRSKRRSINSTNGSASGRVNIGEESSWIRSSRRYIQELSRS